ncbi:DUF2937 family protein [Chelativorans sp. Marseille-P2723]|uniref:DUF2937 family protein n=1 Tax=Chelativorans sp. Marseille-P2723 TaxID=2709133 RepID=UPI00156F6F4C|nr:DUF2937 family protein [Chelativorans sp. Marseille-P2723]
MRAGTIAALVVSLIGGAVASQAPEFAQQYRQRLHGAHWELTQIVTDFDAGAVRHGLDREEALGLYDKVPPPFLQDRSRSMRRIIERAEHLDRQVQRLADLPPVLRPLLVMVDPDKDVFQGTLHDFETAVPLTAHGLVWTAAGLLAGFGLIRLAVFPLRQRRRRPERFASR